MLNGKGSKPALPQMAAALVMFVIATHVRVLQPVHPDTEITVIFRQDGQVKMVGHQAESKHGHGDFHEGMVNRLQESMIIALLVKNLAPTVAAVEHMVANAADRGSCSAGHSPNVTDNPPKSIINMDVPFSSL